MDYSCGNYGILVPELETHIGNYESFKGGFVETLFVLALYDTSQVARERQGRAFCGSFWPAQNLS